MGGGGGLTIAQRQNRADRFGIRVLIKVFNGLGETRGGIAGFLKMKRDCFIGPRVFELMASIASDDDAHAQPPRGFREAARLIAELTGKQEQRWRFFGNHALCRKL
jgi:hypothetical protein